MTLATEISVDAFTLYEYMVNNSDNRIYKGGLLEACKVLKLTAHDHARSRYTRELKSSGLVTSRGRAGWQINPSRMSHVTVVSTGATVSDLMQDTPKDEPPTETTTPEPENIQVPTTRPDHDSYTGTQLAEAVARQLLDRLFGLQQQVNELKQRPGAADQSHELQTLEAKHAELTSEYETFMETAQRNEEELAAKLALAEQARKEAENKAAALQQQVAALMRGVVDPASAEKIRSEAERFLNRSAAS